jgi:glycosyltransferase involved in cell wall biosynthesis
MLRIAPFGVNTGYYRPDGAATRLSGITGRSVNFLTVAAPHIRKGLAETVAAFCEAFGPGDDAGLVVKLPSLAGGRGGAQSLGGAEKGAAPGPLSNWRGRRPWEYKSVDDFAAHARGAQVSFLACSLGEEEMGALYRGADVYVQASYGEGFGLSILEAAAAAKPVIATAWGGATEFLSAESACLVDFDLVDASGFAYDWPGDAGLVHMAHPKVGAVARLMRLAYENPEERAARGSALLDIARSMTWRKSAKAILEGLTI